jgi:uncharacterized protein
VSNLQTLLFSAAALAISLGIHGYVAARLIGPWDLPWWGRALGFALAALSASVIPVMFVLMRRTGQGWADWGQWAGWSWFGMVSILMVAVLIRDLGWGAATLASWAAGPDVLLPEDPQRRALLARSLNLGVAAVAGGIGIVAGVNARRTARVERVQVPIAGLPEALHGFRIAQISDLHVGPTIRLARVKALVDQVNELDADMIAVTGDLVDGSVAALAEWVAPLAGLASRHGTYFVTGNHEYYSGAESWCDHCESSLGWRVLLNEHALVEHDGGRLLVAGVTDPTAGRFVAHHQADLPKSLSGAPPVDVSVLLAHQPKVGGEAAELGFDLQLSGHTHGGQYFPFTVLIHLAQKFVAGLYRHAGMWIYVNRGSAYWGPPMRLGANQEVTLLELVPAA